MRPYSVQEIISIAGANLVHGQAATEVRGVTSDSRKVFPGDLFCALSGERVDGHDFVLDVFRKGAAAAMIEHPVPALLESLEEEDTGGRFYLLQVQSVVKSLQALAASYRGELGTEVIGISGSVGKTSTKDLICSILAQKFEAYGNPGNLNSHVGLPLAVLAINGAPEYAVLEMAMRARGEITELCAIAKPKMGILTDISTSHVGVLGSIEEIAHAKSEILTSLPEDGLGIASGDNEWVRKMSAKAACPVLFYGLSAGCDVRGLDAVSLGAGGSTFRVEVSEEIGDRASCPGSMDFRLKVPGLHQVHNALAAVTVGLLTGVPYESIRDGLENAVMSPMRLQVVSANGVTIINDAYNASPKSMRSALDLLSETGNARKVAVLGDMLEMGAYGPKAHREVGEYARGKASYLACSGDLGKEIIEAWDATGAANTSSWFPDKTHLTEFLLGFVRPGDTVLVKASRRMGFESIVAALLGETGVIHGAH